MHPIFSGVPALAPLLIPLYALADRAFGMARPAWAKKLPVKGAATAILIGAGWLLAGTFGAVAGLTWLIWRSPAWDVFGGSMTPANGREIIGTLARHLIAAPLLMLAAYWGGEDRLTAGLAGVAFATAATSLACWLTREVLLAVRDGVPLGSQNTFVELTRGAAFGACVVAISMELGL